LRWWANFIWTLKRGVGIAAKSRKRPSAKKPQPGQERFDGAPSRFSDDITNKKQIHAGDFSANPGKNTQEKIPGSLRMSFQVHGKLARWTLWAPLAQKVARPHPGLLKV
jgi:hypothetical protein